LGGTAQRDPRAGREDENHERNESVGHEVTSM
jgi:hypothetical protein